MSAPTPHARPVVNPIRTKADWQTQRMACQQDPGAFHGAIARRELHWFEPRLRAWVTYDESAARWTGL